MAISRTLRCAGMIAFVAIVGCSDSSNAPVVVRLDSADEKQAPKETTVAPKSIITNAPTLGPAPTGANVPPTTGSAEAKPVGEPTYAIRSTPTDSPAGYPTPFSQVESRGNEGTASDIATLLNKPAPAVDLSELGHGRFQLANHRGVNIVVLDFWATWCGPCVQELPAMSRVRRSYEGKGVVFRAVNVDEDGADVAAFVKSSHLEMPVAIDEGGKVADLFGVETLPGLVIIDRAGIVRSIQLGAIDNPGAAIKEDLDALLENRRLPQRSMGALADSGGNGDSYVHAIDPHHGDDHGSLTEGHVAGEKNPIRVHSHGTADWRITLESGRVIDVAKTFAQERAGLEERLQAAYDRGSFLRVNHENGSGPFLLVSRRQGSLSGPMASFYPDGSPTAYMDYQAGKRKSALLTWDSQKRPLVFEQYGDGARDGLRCLFKACADNCPEGHVWMVQEWSHGLIEQAHVVPADGKPITFEYAHGKPIPRDDVTTEEFESAMAKLEEFDEKVETNEKQLKVAVGQLYGRERREASAIRRAAAAQRNSQMMASMGSSMRGGYRMPAMVTTRACASG